MTEIAFVLKAVTTLVSTLKKTPSANGKFFSSCCTFFHVAITLSILTQRVRVFIIFCYMLCLFWCYYCTMSMF